MAGRFSIEAIFKATDRLTRPIARMRRQVEGFSRSAASSLREMDSVRERLVSGFQRVGAAAAVAGAITAGVFADIVRTGAEFERTMMSAVAKFGGIQRGTAEFEALRQAAEEVGATTEFDAQQAAGALEVYAAAGFSAAQAVASLAGAGDLATVSGLSLDEAASTAADSLSALGLATEDAEQQARNLTRVNDVLARTSSMVNTSVTDMAEAIKVGGGITVRSGQSIETFGALVGAMAQGNYKGAEAGTAIRNMLLRLQAPAARGSRALHALGVNVRDSQGNMRDMVDVIGELATATADMGTADKNQALARIFGAETIGPALAVLNAGAEGLAGFRDTLNGAEGAAANMAATMRDTTMGDLDGFTSAIDGVKTAIFGVVSGPFRDLLRGLTDWTNKNREVITSGIQEFLTWFQGALPSIVYWGEKIAKVAGIFLVWATAIKAATAAMAIFNAVAALNPVTVILLAVFAAIALIIAFWPEISAFFSDLWESVKWVCEQVVAAFTSAWGTVKENTLAFFSDLWESVKWVGEQVVAAFTSAWETVKEYTLAVFDFILGALMILFGPVIDLFMPVVEFVIDAAQWVISHWSQVRAFFYVLWTFIKTLALGTWDAIVGKVTEVYEKVRSVFALLRAYFHVFWTFIKTLALGTWDAIVGKAIEIYEKVRSAFEPLRAFFADLWNGITDMFWDTVGGVVDYVSGVVDRIRGIGQQARGGDVAGARAAATNPELVMPGERTARSISETTNTSRAELTIRDQTGRAEMTRQPRRGGPQIRLQPSGAL